MPTHACQLCTLAAGHLDPRDREDRRQLGKVVSARAEISARAKKQQVWQVCLASVQVGMVWNGVQHSCINGDTGHHAVDQGVQIQKDTTQTQATEPLQSFTSSHALDPNLQACICLYAHSSTTSPKKKPKVAQGRRKGRKMPFSHVRPGCCW